MRLGTWGAISAGLAVAAGAFAAHALRARLPGGMLEVFETGARYQLAHALAILLADAAAERRPRPALRAAGWLFVAGSVLFSGSLYALALTGVRALGAITPLGGVCFLAGWIAFAWGLGPTRSAERP
ncbi:MAG: hypothetical protein A2W00_15165 [Candidatus Eisenbacteria bacterium RBG_16_71_46]|nr:MAG: hypothetical protein A2W00_15165 [Candidatus Eisenbacteria bacterium RBG_16_71_46]